MNKILKRSPHAVMYIHSRSIKALKIENILSSECELLGKKILEVGTGSGIIASHLAKVTGAFGSVHAVDVVDQRQIDTGFTFNLVEDTSLPFEDNCFDVTVSNHVMEHVGDKNDQTRHLLEIRRVSKPNEVLYIAVPNKWRIMEPHFKLPLLSW